MGYAYKVMNLKEIEALNRSSTRAGRNRGFHMSILKKHLEARFPKDWDTRNYRVSGFPHNGVEEFRVQIMFDPADEFSRGYLDISAKQFSKLRVKSRA